MGTRYVIGQKVKPTRTLYLTDSGLRSSRVADATKFESPAEAKQAAAEYLDREDIFRKPHLVEGWEVSMVNLP